MNMKNLEDIIHETLIENDFIVEARVKPLKQNEIIERLQILGLKENKDFFKGENNSVYANDEKLAQRISEMDDDVLIDEVVSENGSIKYRLIIIE